MYTSLSGNSILISVPTDLPLAPTRADLKFRFLLLAIGFQIVISFSFETLLLRKVVQGWQFILETLTNIGPHWQVNYYYSGLLGRQ